LTGVCDQCGHEETVCAVHGKKQEGEGQAARKLQAKGWSYLHKRLLCPTCESNRKVVKMANPKAKASQPEEPTKAQKRSIMQLLEGCYDHASECYCGGETDASVAEVLNVLPGWVAAIREEFFGPCGTNEDMQALSDDITKKRAELETLIRDTTKQNQKLIDALEGLKGLDLRLDRIKKAVGPHVRKKVGLV